MIPAAGKNPDVNISKSRLPGGRAFMPSASLKRLTKVWREESAGKTKPVVGNVPKIRCIMAKLFVNVHVLP